MCSGQVGRSFLCLTSREMTVRPYSLIRSAESRDEVGTGPKVKRISLRTAGAHGLWLTTQAELCRIGSFRAGLLWGEQRTKNTWLLPQKGAAHLKQKLTHNESFSDSGHRF